MSPETYWPNLFRLADWLRSLTLQHWGSLESERDPEERRRLAREMARLREEERDVLERAWGA